MPLTTGSWAQHVDKPTVQLLVQHDQRCTCIPANEFTEYSGDVTLDGEFAFLTSIEASAFFSFPGTLILSGSFPLLSRIEQRANRILPANFQCCTLPDFLEGRACASDDDININRERISA